jgi:glycosyltransferase involved in cell wall biosynthesis
MRVLLCHQPTDGGVGRHVRDLIEGLVAKGHEVVVCSPALPHGLRAPVAHVRIDLRRAVSPGADTAALVRMARVVRDVRPEVIHAHSSKAGAIARLARPLLGHTPVLYTPHGYAFAGYFSRSLERLAYLGVERALAPLTSRVVCVCEAEAELARSIGSRERVRVIHNGIAPAGEGEADARLLELSRGGPVIGALTLLRPGKGLETLIEAAPHVLASHPQARVAIVGEGPDLAELQALAVTLGVAEAIHFLGPTEQPLPSLRAMDVFVHPSWAESFPYVILEAMSLSLPIVASDVGGIGEAVVDGDSGLLVPPGDERALARALVAMLDDRARGRGLGERARSRVELRFTRTEMVERLAGLYEETVGSRTALLLRAQARSLTRR